MQSKFQRITPFFWFNEDAEAAVAFYTSIFPSSSTGVQTRYTKEAEKVAGVKAGTIMTIAFTLDGQQFTALNGGPHFKFNEALSLVINCESEAEVDHYWERLGEGGDPGAQQCGWLKDKFGVSWQVVPVELDALLADPDAERARRATEAMFTMKKLDMAELRRAADGLAEAKK